MSLNIDSRRDFYGITQNVQGVAAKHADFFLEMMERNPAGARVPEKAEDAFLSHLTWLIERGDRENFLCAVSAFSGELARSMKGTDQGWLSTFSDGQCRLHFPLARAIVSRFSTLLQEHDPAIPDLDQFLPLLEPAVTGTWSGALPPDQAKHIEALFGAHLSDDCVTRAIKRLTPVVEKTFLTFSENYLARPHVAEKAFANLYFIDRESSLETSLAALLFRRRCLKSPEFMAVTEDVPFKLNDFLFKALKSYLGGMSTQTNSQIRADLDESWMSDLHPSRRALLESELDSFLSPPVTPIPEPIVMPALISKTLSAFSRVVDAVGSSLGIQPSSPDRKNKF